jgi:hypothetical protein
MTKRNPSTERSIAVLAQTMERAINDYVAAIAPYYPGVPHDVIKQCELNSRGSGCRCRAYTFRPPGAN